MSNMLFIQKRQIMDACSDKPFKLETDNDVSSLLAFFGQVRDKATVFVQQGKRKDDSFYVLFNHLSLGCAI
jgi:hypothetical protein